MTTIYKDTDHRIEVNNLRDQNGDIVIGATIEMTLYEKDGSTEITGATWPIVMQSINQKGDYFAVLPYDINVVTRKTYILEIVAISTEARRTWTDTIRVERSEF